MSFSDKSSNKKTTANKNKMKIKNEKQENVQILNNKR